MSPLSSVLSVDVTVHRLSELSGESVAPKMRKVDLLLTLVLIERLRLTVGHIRKNQKVVRLLIPVKLHHLHAAS